MMETQYRQYIKFADPNVAKVCIENWSSDGKGLTYADAAKVTSLAKKGMATSAFRLGNSAYSSFDELKYFTGMTTLGPQQAFYNCYTLASITLSPNTTALGNSVFRNTGLIVTGGTTFTFLCPTVMSVGAASLTNNSVNPFQANYSYVGAIRVPADLVQSYKDHWFWGAVLADKIIAIE